MFPLPIFLKKLIQVGTLHVVDAKGRKQTFKGTPGPEVTMRLTDPWLPWKIFFRPGLGAGEAFMKGTLELDSKEGSYPLLYLVTKNMEWRPDNPMNTNGSDPFSRFRSWFSQANPVAISIKNVAHHYDLSGVLYDLFLDKDKQYSCAYFADPKNSLEKAQTDKKAHIAKKLLLKKGMTLLDIGCGWGGLALSLNKITGAKVTGVTLSEQQLAVGNERAKKNKVDKDVEFRLQDYRDVPEKFDRVVSVGMFEHVGRKNYGTFFKKVYDCLNEDGVALIHTIGRADGPGSTDPWTGRYIFPGGYAPSLSEFMPAIEKAGLYVTDIEVLRLHYAETLKEWRRRTFEHKQEICELYNEEFFRMWDFYLSLSEGAFRNLGHVVFQIQLAKKVDTVPMTRDYMYK